MKLTAEQARAFGILVQQPKVPAAILQAMADAQERQAERSPADLRQPLPSAPTATPAPLDDATEEAEQRALAEALDASGVLWCHVPNGGHRHKATAARMKGQGVKPGVPDVLIFTPPPTRPDACGIALELKRTSLRPKRPGAALPACVSAAQRQWLANLEALGWVPVVAYGAADAVAELQRLGVPVR
jgi:hypothetical protein